MKSYATISVRGKKCATCRFYNGNRQIVLSAYKPHLIKAESGSTPCMVNNKRQITANGRCPAWQLWEKLG